MAKLMALVSVAAWIMFALAVTLGRADWTGLKEAVTSCTGKIVKKSKTIGELEAKPIKDRSQSDWDELGKACIKKLSRESESMTRQEVWQLMGKLEENPRRSHLKKNHENKSWLEIFNNLKQDLACHDGPTRDAADQIASKCGNNQAQCNYLQDYIGHYLEKCKYEDEYRKVTGDIKQTSRETWNSDDYPSFHSYLMVDFWQKLASISKREIFRKLKWFLSVFRDLSKFESISNETGCKERQHMMKFADWLYESRIAYPTLNKLIKYYFTQFLEKCGFDGAYRKFTNQQTSADPPLASSLLSMFEEKPTPDKKTIEHNFSVLAEFFDQMADPSQVVEPDSNNALQIGLISDLKRTKAEDYIKMDWELDDKKLQNIVRAYDFKVVARQPNNRESWAFLKKLSDLMEFQIMPRTENDIRSSRSIIEAAFPSVVKEIKAGKWTGTQYAFETENFDKNLKKHCKILWQHVWPKMCMMTYNFARAAEDKEIMDLMNYMSYCSFVDMDAVSDERECSKSSVMFRDIFTQLDAPYYPREGQVFTVKDIFLWYLGVQPTKESLTESGTTMRDYRL